VSSYASEFDNKSCTVCLMLFCSVHPALMIGCKNFTSTVISNSVQFNWRRCRTPNLMSDNQLSIWTLGQSNQPQWSWDICLSLYHKLSTQLALVLRN